MWGDCVDFNRRLAINLQRVNPADSGWDLLGDLTASLDLSRLEAAVAKARSGDSRNDLGLEALAAPAPGSERRGVGTRLLDESVRQKTSSAPLFWSTAFINPGNTVVFDSINITCKPLVGVQPINGYSPRYAGKIEFVPRAGGLLKGTEPIVIEPRPENRKLFDAYCDCILRLPHIGWRSTSTAMAADSSSATMSIRPPSSSRLEYKHNSEINPRFFRSPANQRLLSGAFLSLDRDEGRPTGGHMILTFSGDRQPSIEYVNLGESPELLKMFESGNEPFEAKEGWQNFRLGEDHFGADERIYIKLGDRPMTRALKKIHDSDVWKQIKGSGEPVSAARGFGPLAPDMTIADSGARFINVDASIVGSKKTAGVHNMVLLDDMIAAFVFEGRYSGDRVQGLKNVRFRLWSDAFPRLIYDIEARKLKAAGRGSEVSEVLGDPPRVPEYKIEGVDGGGRGLVDEMQEILRKRNGKWYIKQIEKKGRPMPNAWAAIHPLAFPRWIKSIEELSPDELTPFHRNYVRGVPRYMKIRRRDAAQIFDCIGDLELIIPDWEGFLKRKQAGPGEISVKDPLNGVYDTLRKYAMAMALSSKGWSVNFADDDCQLMRLQSQAIAIA